MARLSTHRIHSLGKLRTDSEGRIRTPYFPLTIPQDNGVPNFILMAASDQVTQFSHVPDCLSH